MREDLNKAGRGGGYRTLVGRVDWLVTVGRSVWFFWKGRGGGKSHVRRRFDSPIFQRCAGRTLSLEIRECAGLGTRLACVG